jgi:hypothetical protein
MKRMKNTPNYIKTLVKPSANKATNRKVWSVDLETVWLPFFTATNTMQETNLPAEALGAPLRLAYNQDGSVKFSKSGKPVVKVCKDINDSVRMVRENFVAGLQNYANGVITENTEAYKAQVKLCQQAGKPILENDKAKLEEAMNKLVEQALAEADKQEASPPTETPTPNREPELASV